MATTARPRSAAESKRARPSPCAVATGMRLPAMPANRIDGLSATSTITKRASNCSERLRTNSGQCAAPGISSLQRRHHLAAVADAEREAVWRGAKNASNSARARAWNRIDLAQPWPPPSTSP